MKMFNLPFVSHAYFSISTVHDQSYFMNNIIVSIIYTLFIMLSNNNSVNSNISIQ